MKKREPAKVNGIPEKSALQKFIDEVNALAVERGIAAMIVCAAEERGEDDTRFLSYGGKGDVISRLDLAARLYGACQQHTERLWAEVIAQGRRMERMERR